MKKMYLLLFLCFFVLGSVFAAGLSIKVNPKQVAINSNITVDYAIEQDEATSFAYQIGVKGQNNTITIINNTATGLTESGSFQYNVTALQAGDYDAFILLYPATYWPTKFTILPYLDFSAAPDKVDIFVYDNTAVQAVVIKNTGNTPVFISSSPSGFKSEAAVLPLTTELGVGESKSFLISVNKPSEHYTATIAFTGSYVDFNKTISVPLMVYNPVVKINLLNVSRTKSENATYLLGKIENAGNVYRNITAVIKYTGGERTEQIVVQANQTSDFNYSFAKTDKIDSLKLKFINSNGKEEIITKSFSGFSLPGLSFKLPTLPIVKGNTWLFIIIGILLVLVIGLVAFRRRPKPEVVAAKPGVTASGGA